MKRLRRSLNQQLEHAEQKAMKPHAADCPDVLTCLKVQCFERVPDKIVSAPYIIKKQ